VCLIWCNGCMEVAGAASAEHGPGAASGASNGAGGGLVVPERTQHTFKAPAPRTSLLGAHVLQLDETASCMLGISAFALSESGRPHLSSEQCQCALFAGLDVLARKKRAEVEAEGGLTGLQPRVTSRSACC